MSVPELTTDVPSRSDRLIRSLGEGVGGPLGRHAVPGHRWWNPARVALLVATCTYLAGLIFRLPCRITAPGQVPDSYKLMCYSDIPLLYPDRGLLQGNTPTSTPATIGSGYPPLTGWFLEAERLINQCWAPLRAASRNWSGSDPPCCSSMSTWCCWRALLDHRLGTGLHGAGTAVGRR